MKIQKSLLAVSVLAALTSTAALAEEPQQTRKEKEEMMGNHRGKLSWFDLLRQCDRFKVRHSHN